MFVYYTFFSKVNEGELKAALRQMINDFRKIGKYQFFNDEFLWINFKNLL